MVTLNRIVALAMVAGPATALDRLAAAADDVALAGHYAGGPPEPVRLNRRRKGRVAT